MTIKWCDTWEQVNQVQDSLAMESGSAYVVEMNDFRFVVTDSRIEAKKFALAGGKIAGEIHRDDFTTG